MANLEEQLTQMKAELAREKEAREAAEKRSAESRDTAELRAAVTAVEQRAAAAAAAAEQNAAVQKAQHEDLMKMFAQLSSSKERVAGQEQDAPDTGGAEDAYQALAPPAGRNLSDIGGRAVPAEVGPREEVQSVVSSQDRAYGFGGEFDEESGPSSYNNFKIATPVLKDRTQFYAFHEKVRVFSKVKGFESVLTTEAPVNVGSTERSELLAQGVTVATYRRHMRAWAFFSEAFVLAADIGRFSRSSSPRELWEATKKFYLPSTAGQHLALRKKLSNFPFPHGSDPVQKFLEIEDHAELMREAGIAVDDQEVYGAYVGALPRDYHLEVRELNRQQFFDRHEIISLVQTCYELLRKDKKHSSSSRALIADGSGGNGGRDKLGVKRGGRNGRGNGNGNGSGNGSGGKTKKSNENDGEAADDGKKPGKGPICYQCHARGHIARECKAKICEQCKGIGHDKSNCPSPVDALTNLMVKLLDPDSEPESTTSSMDEAGFLTVEVEPAMCGLPRRACVAPGKCNGCGSLGVVSGLALKAGEDTEPWFFDTGASGNVSMSKHRMINFRPCKKSLKMGSGQILPIEGQGDIPFEFQSGSSVVPMMLENVAWCRDMRFHLVSLAQLVEQDHTYSGNKKALTVRLTSGKSIKIPPVGRMYLAHGRRLAGEEIEKAFAVIAPGLMPTTDVDINRYHRTTAHTHPRLLRAAAAQQGVKLRPGKLLPCVGCSAAKGFRAPVKHKTANRSQKRLGRVFVDSSGKRPVKSQGGKQFSIIFRDDKTRMTFLDFMRRKSESPTALRQFLADVRDVGLPELIRSDDASELRGGEFADICREHRIKQEFTSPSTPQLNGVAERGLALVEKLAKAVMIQAHESFVGQKLPATGPLWPEAQNYACDVLNRSPTTANPGNLSPYQMWYGNPPPPTLLEWLQPCFYTEKRKRKIDAQAQPGFYLGPAKNHPSGTMRIFSQETRQVIISRDVTWRHVPPATPLPPGQLQLPAPSEDDRGDAESDDVSDDDSGEGTSSSGSGRDDASDSSDDDLDVTWEDNPHVEETARNDGKAAGKNDADSIREGGSPSFQSASASRGSPSTSVSRGESFGGGEIASPSNSGSSGGSSSSSGSSGNSSSSSSNNNQTPDPEEGEGGDDGGVAEIGDDASIAEISKGEKRRIESWPRWGNPIRSGPRPSKMREGRQVIPEDPGGGQGGGSEHALLVKAEDAYESQYGEIKIGDYSFGENELSGMFASLPMQSADELANGIFSFMGNLDYQGEDYALVAEETKGESLCEFDMPSGHVSLAEDPPVSVRGVYKSKNPKAWLHSMKVEFDGLKQAGTFKVLDGLPEGEKAIGGMWILSYKTDKNAHIVKTKARLVALGNMQKEGVNYSRTSAPTPAGPSVKIVLVVANELGYLVRHFDVKQAFATANIDCKVIMKLPAGCGDLSGKYVELKKALYGLKQSALLWNELMFEKLVTRHGMEQCKTDPCVFRLIRDGSVVMILAVHVDDMAVAGEKVEVDKLLETLNEDFTTNDLGELSFFTGCSVIQDVEKGRLRISQETFIETLARRFDVSTTSRYPASRGTDLGPKRDDEPGGTWPYKEAVGGLMWLVVMSRVDIANSVREVARNTSAPTERHWKAVLQIIKYLLGTKDLSLTFERWNGLELSVYADANYAEKADDRRSVSGVAITLGKASVSWFSSTQKVVSLSTTEAEYLSLGDGVKATLFANAVLTFIVPSLSGKCFKVFVDNEGAIDLANNPLSSGRTKHIDVRFHFVRDLVKSKTISIVYVPTREQRADILTKALTGEIFKEHRNFLMNIKT